MKKALLYFWLLLLYSGITLAQSSPTQLSPANGSTGIQTNANTLSWYFISTSPVSYNLQVSLSQSFGTTVFNTTVTGGNNYYNNVPGLLTGTTYYWRVNATNAQGTTGWSSTWSFTTSGTPPSPFIITASAGANGAISPSGNVAVTPGSDKAFTITPNNGYIISDVLVDGVSVGAVNNYTFTNVNSNHTISASFSLFTYTITASAGANGSISPSGSVLVVPGANQAFTITPSANYHVADVLVDGVSVGAVSNYTFTNVQSAHTISASFAINTNTIFVTSTAGGSISPAGNATVPYGGNQAFNFTPDPGFFVIDRIVNGVSLGEGTSYTFTNVTSDDTLHVVFTDHYNIVASAGAHGSISPSGSVNATKGGNSLFTFTPATGYHVADVLVDGASVGAVPNYTFNNVQTHHTISVSFAINSYTITVTSAGNGSISPAGNQILNYGSNQVFLFNPDSAYFVSDILVDGVSVGHDTSYTFTSISANHTLHVIFSDHFTITATATAGGTISPLGVVNVFPLVNQQFTMAPVFNFQVADLIIDGVSVDSTTSYTFLSIHDNHTIHAVFDHIKDTITVSVVGDSGGTIYPPGPVIVNRGDSVRFYIRPNSGYASYGFSIDGGTNNLDTTYLFSYVSGNHTIIAGFSPSRTIYVSTSGNDNTGNGTENNPYQTILRGNQASLVGDTIKISNGIYNELLNPVPGRNYQGTTATYIYAINTTNSDHFSIKDIRLNAPGINMPYIIIGNSHDFILDNIVINNGGFDPIRINQSYNFTIKNSNFSNNGSFNGVVIFDSHHFNLSDVTSNNNGNGLQLDSVSSFSLNNVTTSNSFYAGTVIDYAKNGVITNLESNYNRTNNGPMAGLIISSSSNLTFINGGFSYNGNYGILFSPANSLNFSQFAISMLNINNITFNGNFNITHNPYGIYLKTDQNLNPYVIVSPVFDGHFYMDDNFVDDVYLENKILSPVFKGMVFIRDSVNFASPAILIKGANSFQMPQDVVINNCIFHPTIQTAIALLPWTGGLRVNGRNNNFMAAQSYNQIAFFISDSLDGTPGNLDQGVVDYSGSTFGFVPTITGEFIPNGYRGGSYLLDISIDPKLEPYYYIKGKYTYETSKLQYLGYVSNGLFNQNQWNVIITETTPGVIDFTGFGANPLSESGSMFQLNMKIRSAAPDTIAVVGGLTSDFMGNDSVGAFQLTPGIFFYHNAPGPLQSRGDVNLDGAVSMDDFYALLYHLASVTYITDPQALINADFDLDGDLDNDDLADLYTFISTGVIPTAPSQGSGQLNVNNISYDKNNTAAIIPVGLSDAKNLRSLELTLNYDASLINFKAFTSALNLDNNLVYAFESKPGEAKFIFQASNSQEGDLNTGELVLNFKNAKIPVGTEIQTYYKLNGGETKAGPQFILKENGAVTAVEDAQAAIPDKYDISQNYPNPFNPVTNIRFSIPEASNVVIKIYNMLGQEVRTLVNEFRNPGFYETTWNGTSESGITVASGTYIYRIVSGSFVQTKKMIFLK